MFQTFHPKKNPLVATARIARDWALAGTVAVGALSAGHPALMAGTAGLFLAAALPAGPAAAQTSGKSGDTKAAKAATPQAADADPENAPDDEASAESDADTAGGLVTTEGPVAVLNELGVYESTYRVAAQLFLEEQRDLARAHLSGSEMLSYDDVAEMLAEYDAASFEAEHEAFVAAISGDASFEDVVEELNSVTEALLVSSFAVGAGLREEILSMKDLVTLSAIEFESAVDEDGKVTDTDGYRKSWGYFDTALRRAETLAGALDPVWAQAGAEVVKSLVDLSEIYPDLTSGEADGDAESLFDAAAQIDEIAQRQDN